MNNQSELFPYKCRAWLKKMYWDEDMTVREIARMCGVGYTTIFRQLQKFMIPRRKPGWQGNPREASIGVKLSLIYREALDRFCMKLGQRKSEIVRSAILDYMGKKNFNPFKEE